MIRLREIVGSTVRELLSFMSVKRYRYADINEFIAEWSYIINREIA